MITQRAGVVKYSENLEVAESNDEFGAKVSRCMGRHAKITIKTKDKKTNSDFNIPYGANLNVNDGDKVSLDKG